MNITKWLCLMLILLVEAPLVSAQQNFMTITSIYNSSLIPPSTSYSFDEINASTGGTTQISVIPTLDAEIVGGGAMINSTRQILLPMAVFAPPNWPSPFLVTIDSLTGTPQSAVPIISNFSGFPANIRSIVHCAVFGPTFSIAFDLTSGSPGVLDSITGIFTAFPSNLALPAGQFFGIESAADCAGLRIFTTVATSVLTAGGYVTMYGILMYDGTTVTQILPFQNDYISGLAVNEATGELLYKKTTSSLILPTTTSIETFNPFTFATQSLVLPDTVVFSQYLGAPGALFDLQQNTYFFLGGVQQTGNQSVVGVNLTTSTVNFLPLVLPIPLQIVGNSGFFFR